MYDEKFNVAEDFERAGSRGKKCEVCVCGFCIFSMNAEIMVTNHFSKVTFRKKISRNLLFIMVAMLTAAILNFHLSIC